MKFFNHLFGKNKKNNDDEESPFLPKETEPIELIFAKNFTKKGGKFLYCENKNEVLQYFDEILIENNWTLSSITCKNDFLIDYFGLIKLNNKDIIDAAQKLSISVRSHSSSISLVDAKKIKNLIGKKNSVENIISVNKSSIKEKLDQSKVNFFIFFKR